MAPCRSIVGGAQVRRCSSTWVWSLIGAAYYGIFGFVLYRILRIEPADSAKAAAVIVIVLMMLANGLANYVMFRAQNLRCSFIVGAAFPFLDVLLFVLVLRLDSTAAWILGPYLIYRVYAVWWGYKVWKLNPRVIHAARRQ